MKEDSVVTYSQMMGCIYIFNLIVGTGALAMPKAFQEAGYVLSAVVLAILCFISYITSTFVIEAMSISNGLNKLCKLKYTMRNSAFTNVEIDEDAIRTLHNVNEIEVHQRHYGTAGEPQEEQLPLSSTINPEPTIDSSYFEINDIYEMGQMAITYFNRVGLILFYLSFCLYLYGDLAVYAAAVPNSLMEVACTYKLPFNLSSTNETLNDSEPCWPDSEVTRRNAYHIFLTCFLLLLCPFVFFNLSKTKLLQVSTLFMRWFAFSIMIILMSIYLTCHDGNRSSDGIPCSKAFSFSKTPNLIGVCIYSFMCHHSLPSLVTPMRRKHNIFRLIAIVFSFILGFYLLLCFLAAVSFSDIQALITLNFDAVSNPDSTDSITNTVFFQYYLALFPVFSLSASFPIIGITLRNNLRNLITCGTGRHITSRLGDKFLYPMMALIPPIVVVYATSDVQMLVGITGSYAGALVQYVVPACLVLCARKHARILISKELVEASVDQRDGANSPDNLSSTTANLISDELSNSSNIDLLSSAEWPQHLHIIHESPFKHRFWAYLVLLWALLSIVFVTANHVISYTQSKI